MPMWWSLPQALAAPVANTRVVAIPRETIAERVFKTRSFIGAPP
jgi:hypothetical protein